MPHMGEEAPEPRSGRKAGENELVYDDDRKTRHCDGESPMVEKGYGKERRAK